VKPLPQKTQFAILKALLRNWHLCKNNYRCARLLMRFKSSFDYQPIMQVIWWMVVFDGDWDSVRRELSQRPAPWHKKLFSWADKVKGGAL
jgi:hypothetical protein